MSGTSSHRGLISGAKIAFGIKILAAAVTYGFTILLGRFMDIEDFGLVGILLSASLFLSVVGVRGQHTAILRFAPTLLKTPTAMAGFLGQVYRRSAIGLGCVTFLAIAGYFALTVSQGEVPRFEMALGLLLIALVGWIDLQAHEARALGSITTALLPKEVLWRGATSVIVIGLLAFRPNGDVSLLEVVSALIAVLVVLILVQALILRKVLGSPQPVTLDQSTMPVEWRPASDRFWVSSASSMIFTNADTLVVGIFAGAEAAGLYYAANRLVMVLGFFQLSFNVVAGPMLSERYEAGQIETVRLLVANSVVRAFIPTALIAVVLCVGAPWFLGLFGPEFESQQHLVVILSIATVIKTALGPADILLNMCRQENVAMRVNLVSLIVGMGFLILGGWFGQAEGVAIAVIGALAFRGTSLWNAARIHLGMRTDIAYGFANFRSKEVEST